MREFDETAQCEDDFQAPAFAAYVRGERFGKSPESAYGALARHLAGGASTLVVLFPAFPARAQGWLEEWVSAGVSPWDALQGDWCRVGGDMARAMQKASKKDIPHAGECADAAESSEE